MSYYETIFVLDPQLEDEAIEDEIRKVQSLIESRNGTILQIERWGRRRLAYEVKRKQQGIYTAIRLDGDPSLPGELSRAYRMNERVLRYLTVRTKGEGREARPEDRAEIPAEELA